MKASARTITVSAALTALTVVFLFLGNVFPAGRLGLIAVASLFVTAAVIEAGLGAAAFVFVGSAVLGALILPDKWPRFSSRFSSDIILSSKAWPNGSAAPL
jgi:hypothetical protein